MKLPENVKLHPVPTLDARYSVSEEFVIDFRSRWVARVDGQYIAWSDDKGQAEMLCKIHANARK